ncbi:MAG: hypothetical protein G01um101448_158 [Parcubacteria group bacterium Gr01-1014_48]|nr:MAG: hypothetical protein Greene041614_113 [Parcubacteria group bacterium Greene0416_14]TSC74431.1 MAG: hypothetical protein G01um101448_158 [Parcubacteria group bacterium Gr01-1014_48]TSD01284.1 MAG: hypothetical protein Greene101415_373 [Parcubacteria group bacterium Greene1014_15]TSD08395.1 MAG: hypothetical protein Greene07144_111 [Parcubacteria group bacterium Greene0714_4]
MLKALAVALFLCMLPLVSVFAASDDITTLVQKTAVLFAMAGSVLIAFLVIISILVRHQSELLKKVLFFSFLAAIGAPTLYFVGSTLYVNTMSDTKGPVHWHADFQIYACGQPIKLASPTSQLSNKVGTPIFHHHDDNRIHIEGVVANKQNFELADFFSAIGGELTKTSFTLPTNAGKRELRNGDLCGTDTGTWQVFVYRQDESNPRVFRQLNVKNYTQYLLSPHQNIPPGDCIIMEFDNLKEKTEHLCPLHAVELQNGAISVK